MSRITGWVDPQWRATWEPIVAKLAAPGMANPDDDEPCVKGTPSQDEIDADTRSLGQRAHDAFTAVGRPWPLGSLATTTVCRRPSS